MRRLIRGEPEINVAQIARLAGPTRPHARDRLPYESMVMDVEWHDGQWSPRVSVGKVLEVNSSIPERGR